MARNQAAEDAYLDRPNPLTEKTAATMPHYRFDIKGYIQGVGFRPFVYQLATELALSGHVQNEITGVTVHIDGSQAEIDTFRARLIENLPAPAKIDRIQKTAIDDSYPQTGFRILNTDAKPSRIGKSASDSALVTDVPTDQTVCHHCLSELFNPNNRRYKYPFITCTSCGPRYSLIESMPFEREDTSMVKFKQCTACLKEYTNPGNRRFHSQTNACTECGPQLSLLDAKGEKITGRDIADEAVRRLAEGQILAIKGIGGFHLMCDARNATAVNLLRQRKNRAHKPFAIMALNSLSITNIGQLDDASAKQLNDQRTPIVLLPKTPNCDSQLVGVAPNVSDVGVMLPQTPLHFLLFKSYLDRQEDTQPANWRSSPHPLLLVATSANLSGEPIISDNIKCIEKLANIADAFIVHDRDILQRCDDSIYQSSTVIRRARGWTPSTLALSHTGASVLGCGANLKNTFCLAHTDKAILSPHMSNLSSAEACHHYRQTIEKYLSLLAIKPEAVACDHHPDFYSSRFAETFSQSQNIPLIRVQHHHAHLASVMAEHKLQGAYIGLALDGVGLGENNHAWGGELLYGEGVTSERLSYLPELSLPGGDKATTEIWRIGAALLSKQQRGPTQTFPQLRANPAHMMLFGDALKHQPKTSSLGRWFDAIAAITGIIHNVSYEGQGAMMLEAFAHNHTNMSTKRLITFCVDGHPDFTDLVAHILTLTDPALAAKTFHTELISGLACWVEKAAKQRLVKQIICSGGCFQNRLLRKGIQDQLGEKGYQVYFNERVPANDGGISLGQAWIARLQMEQ